MAPGESIARADCGCPYLDRDTMYLLPDMTGDRAMTPGRYVRVDHQPGCLATRHKTADVSAGKERLPGKKKT